MPIFCIDFHDDGPDAKGRRRFALFWKCYRPFYDERGRETHWADGVRAQEFCADPSRWVRHEHAPARAEFVPQGARLRRTGVEQVEHCACGARRHVWITTFKVDASAWTSCKPT